VNVGPFQIVIILLVVLVLFGRGRISETMGDFGKGIKSFKKGMTDEEPAKPAQRIEGPAEEVKVAEKQSTPDKTAN
jgi:sec-independent protein translocase protein TatA